MSILKYVERLDRMNNLIQRKSTGDPDEFARKLGITKSMLMKNLRDMRDLGAKISYCKTRESYQYEDEFCIFIGNSKDFKSRIKGGFSVIFWTKNHLIKNKYQCNNITTAGLIFKSKQIILEL